MKLYCVFVGIDEYRDDKIKNLRFAARDAEEFHDLVNKSILKDELKTWLLINQHATKKAIEYTIGSELASYVNEEDIVFLYFSGHGSPETTIKIDELSRYLILYDTDYNQIFETGLNLEQRLPELIKRISAKLIVVFIDSCFSGGAGGQPFKGRTFEGPNLKKSGLSPRGGFSLKNLDLGKGRVIISACDDNEVALEGSGLKHGVFTYHLLQILSKPDGDEPTITIALLYELLQKGVRTSTKNRQSPVFNGRISGARIPIFTASTATSDTSV